MITGCVVDLDSRGFQCTTFPKTKFFLAAPGNKDLECIHPEDIELAIKACKQGTVIALTTCQLDWNNETSTCTDPDKSTKLVALSTMSNYFCLSGKHKRRLQEKCGKIKPGTIDTITGQAN